MSIPTSHISAQCYENHRLQGVTIPLIIANQPALSELLPSEWPSPTDCRSRLRSGFVGALIASVERQSNIVDRLKQKPAPVVQPHQPISKQPLMLSR